DGTRTTATPDNHFTARPDCRVEVSGGRCVANAGSDPTIRNPIVSAAGVQISWISAAPDGHFSPSPDCCVIAASGRRVSNACCHPAIGAWIISPAAIQVHEIGRAHV